MPACATVERPIRLEMLLAGIRVLCVTRRDWTRQDEARRTRACLTPPAAPDTVAASLIADAGETGPRTPRFAQAPAPKVYRPGNSQAKGPHRIGLSGE